MAETLQTDDLRRLVQEGIDSGPGLDADAVFARLRDSLRARFGQPEIVHPADARLPEA